MANAINGAPKKTARQLAIIQKQVHEDYDKQSFEDGSSREYQMVVT